MFCPKCGAKVEDGAPFCSSCGYSTQQVQDLMRKETPSQITPPGLGMPVGVQQTSSYQRNVYPPQDGYGNSEGGNLENPYRMPARESGGKNTPAFVGMLLGIFGLSAGCIGGILFGFIPASVGFVCCVVAIVLGVIGQKHGRSGKGTAALVCGMIGVILNVCLFVTCMTCTVGACAIEQFDDSQFNKWGVIGRSCMIEQRNKQLMEEFAAQMDDLATQFGQSYNSGNGFDFDFDNIFGSGSGSFDYDFNSIDLDEFEELFSSGSGWNSNNFQQYFGSDYDQFMDMFGSMSDADIDAMMEEMLEEMRDSFGDIDWSMFDF